MTAIKPVNLWPSNEHARDYLERADSISHRGEGESALLEFIPQGTRRILNLGTGNGRLLALVRTSHPDTEAVAMPGMVARDWVYECGLSFGSGGSWRCWREDGRSLGLILKDDRT